jgi:hypothetical protein
MTRTNRIERLFNTFAVTMLTLYLLGFLHETVEQYLI